VVAGRHDGKFVALAERLAASIATATLAVLDGAGHTAHLVAPDRFLAVVQPWLAATRRPGATALNS
jgi:pimeloyl-ACP methyl ester carboxylesterase